MSIRRSLLLAGMALSLVVAVPAGASAAEIKMGGASEPNAVITASGIVGFNILGSWFQCTTHFELNGQGSATTAHMTTWQITTNTCEGEGIFEGCELEEHDLTREDGSTTAGANKDKPNWTVHVTGTSPNIHFKLTNMKVHYLLNNCPFFHVFTDFSDTDSRLTPTTQTNMTAVTIHGEGTAEFETSGSTLPSEAYSGNETTGRGTIPLTGASSGTYSLG